MADNCSFRSTNTLFSRGARPESGRLKRKYPYRWLFDQIHVKSIVFYTQIFSITVAITGFCLASHLHGTVSPPPQGSILSNLNGPFGRNALNISAYYLLFSVITAFLGMRISETCVSRRNFPSSHNPALLLVPSCISTIAFIFPLIFWTLHIFKPTISHSKLHVLSILNCLRFSIVPVIAIWVMYIYFLYGFSLGFLYYHRRGDQQLPTSLTSPFRRSMRKPSQSIGIRKGSSHRIVDLSSTLNDSTSSHGPSKLNSSVSPRSFRQLETVDEEAQSRTSSD